MSEKELAEILKYSSPNTLWIITWNDLLKELFCPFKVLVKQGVGELKKGDEVMVEGVKVTVSLKTVYIIKNDAYYYFHFEIIDSL